MKATNKNANPYELRDGLSLPVCSIKFFSGNKSLKANGYVGNSKVYGPDNFRFGTYDSLLYNIESSIKAAIPAQFYQPNFTLNS